MSHTAHITHHIAISSRNWTEHDSYTYTYSLDFLRLLKTFFGCGSVKLALDTVTCELSNCNAVIIRIRFVKLKNRKMQVCNVPIRSKRQPGATLGLSSVLILTSYNVKRIKQFGFKKEIQKVYNCRLRKTDLRVFGSNR